MTDDAVTDDARSAAPAASSLPAASSGGGAPSHAPRSMRILDGYRPKGVAPDEMLGPDGRPRAHWRMILERLEQMGPAGLDQRWRTARRLIHENGVTYNVYGDPDGMERPWELDAVPLPMPMWEWRRLADGLAQRARLLNWLVQDIYGDQRSVKDGLIHPALIFANPRFLRPCVGLRPAGGVHVHFYGCDLARGPDGRWRVLFDRTQAPSGAGYALENRIVVSRTFADLFRDAQAHRMASFFQSLRDLLNGLSSRGDDSRVVLLTPGPYNETYFEHAYLARYLGYLLAEGEDLTMRDGKVWLKTLGGLQPVDAILRRLDDDFCDPLELRLDSALGVAGLTQAARNGAVAMANALGAGVVECVGLQPFLNDVSRRYFGEDLLLPQVETWWCGRADHRRFVLDHLDELLIQPTFQARTLLSPPPGMIIGAELSSAQKDQLRSRIAAQGFAFVAQRPFHVSTAPVWNAEEARLEPRPLALRSFACASLSDQSWVVMPGGLARVAAGAELWGVSQSYSAGSKDVWVLADGQVDNFSLLRQASAPVALRRSSADLPSRTVESLYWLGRYAERAEAEMRLLRALVQRLGEESGFGGAAELAALVRVLGDQWRITPDVARRAVKETDGGDPRKVLAAEIHGLMTDPNRPNGLRETVGHLARIATVVRDRLSFDAWRALNLTHRLDDLARKAAPMEISDALTEVSQLILTMSAFSGMEMENMTRGAGWRFLDMGRRIERAIQTNSLIRSMLAERDAEKEGSLEVMLELGDSFMTYRQRYFVGLRLAPVIDLLLLDESNPRSVGFQLQALERHAFDLPRQGDRDSLTLEQRLIIGARTELRLAHADQLCLSDGDEPRAGLRDLCLRMAQTLPDLSEVLARSYFAHAAAHRQEGTIVRDPGP